MTTFLFLPSLSLSSDIPLSSLGEGVERREREGDRLSSLLGGAGEGVGVGDQTVGSQRGEQAWEWGAGGRLRALWEPSDVLAFLSEWLLPTAGRKGGRGDAARAGREGEGGKEELGGDLSFSESMWSLDREEFFAGLRWPGVFWS